MHVEMVAYLDVPMNATPKKDRTAWYHQPEFYTGDVQYWYKISPAAGSDNMMYSIYKSLSKQGFVTNYMYSTGVVWARKRSDRDKSILLLIVGNNTITEHTKLS